jgi:hypothetical protein
MDNTDEKMKIAMEIAMRNAKVILFEAGLSESDDTYSLRLYELQFKIYHDVKKCMNISNDKH